ncbi:MAG: hypothetical protein ACLFPO_08645 [Spirochaetaceae bacterium]
MLRNNTDSREPEPFYARILRRVVNFGTIFMLVSFVIYAFDILPSVTAADRVPTAWHLPADEGAPLIGRPPLWHWLSHPDRPDLLTLGSLTVLAATTPIAFIALSVRFLRRRDFAYALMVLMQLGVLLLAASGMIG